ncbi:arginine deiminase family protein [Vibrio chagasii]|nr:arginine deiminase family protein [Vibrio chagasii]
MLGGVSINPMAKPARQRETNHACKIYRWHPTFAGQDFIKYFAMKRASTTTTQRLKVVTFWHITAAQCLFACRSVPRQGVEHLSVEPVQTRSSEASYRYAATKTPLLLHAPTCTTHMNEDTFSVYPEVVSKDVKC